ncbi:FmdB family zinc ribbon protein [Candidatus Poribacteria bacterium]
MPTYEYECEKCGIDFERFQSMKDEPIKKCPECGGPVKRLIGAGAGFIFKGSGFYITDYRSESYKRDAKKEEGLANTSGSTKSEKKSEEKKSDKSDKGDKKE